MFSRPLFPADRLTDPAFSLRVLSAANHTVMDEVPGDRGGPQGAESATLPASDGAPTPDRPSPVPPALTEPRLPFDASRPSRRVPRPGQWSAAPAARPS